MFVWDSLRRPRIFPVSSCTLDNIYLEGLKQSFEELTDEAEHSINGFEAQMQQLETLTHMSFEVLRYLVKQNDEVS